MQNILQENHWMIGVDIHDYLPAPIPVPITGVHLNAASLCWLVPAQKTVDVFGKENKLIIHKGSDIGALIPHLCVMPPSPTNLLSPIHMACSGSKSHFGPASVKMNGKSPASAFLFFLNFNLNCQGPTTLIPTAIPTGIVLGFNTIQTKLSLGDFLSGVFSMIMDSLFQTLFDLTLSKCIGKYAEAQLKFAAKAGIVRGIKAYKAVTKSQIPEIALNLIFGTPLSSSVGGELEKHLESDLGWINLYGKATGVMTEKISEELQEIGDEIQSKIDAKINKTADKLKEMKERAKEKAEEIGERAKEKAEEIGERAKEKAEEIGERAKEKAEEIGEQVEQSGKELVEAAENKIEAKMKEIEQELCKGVEHLVPSCPPPIA